ncbi:MAG: DNA (cytosine-5-)-methyltransferase [Sulfitobacter sp.]|nr:DNA (cytosine-5-)-methyltransferase [Sulfitobacter sp.]
MSKPTAISLFSGAGGMDIGFSQAGFDVKLAVELDPSCCDTLRANLTKTKVLEADVSKLSGAELCDLAGLEIGNVDCLFGGPPCQSFSLAGDRKGLNDPRGELVGHFIRLVREIGPKSFVMENVKGMANWQSGAVLEMIENEIAAPVLLRGYEYQYKAQHKVLDAVNFGVPQHRERIFVVGNRLEKSMSFPEPTHNSPKRPHDNRLKPTCNVGKVLNSLPEADQPSETALRVSGTIKERRVKHGY